MKQNQKRSKSVKSFKNSSINITPEEVYKLSSREIDWGIEGYNIPRYYFDYQYEIWKRQRADIINRKTKSEWPPKDWPKTKDEGKRIPPKRKNFLDEVQEWSRSFYNEQRAKDILERKPGIDKEYVKKTEKDTKKRDEFLKREKEKATWKKERDAFVPDYKSQGLDKIKEDIKTHNKEKEVPYTVRMKKKYIKGKEQFPRCDRVTVVADAEFVGEQIPFYNTPADESGKIDKKKLFWPDKFVTMTRYPAWKIFKPFGVNNNTKAVEERIKEKVDNYLSSKNMKKDDLNIQLRQTFHNVTHHGRLYMTIHKPTDWKNEEHHKKAEEDHPRVTPGPDHYWKIPDKFDYSKKSVDLHDITDSNGKKIYYMDRRRTDKRVYKSGMRKSVY